MFKYKRACLDFLQFVLRWSVALAIVCLAFQPQLARAESSCTVITSTPLPFTGHEYDDAGDVNSDGLADFMIYNTTTRLVSGNDGSVLLSVTSTHSTQSPADGFGQVGSIIGDINGDGRQDFIVGVPYSRDNNTVGGRVDVFDGETGAVLYSLTPPLPVDGDQFGITVDDLGDINGDGFGDFIVGAPQLTSTDTLYDPLKIGPGRAFVYSGVDGALLYQYSGDSLQDAYGWQVRGIGNADGDGVNDFAVSAPAFYPYDNIRAGGVNVYSGASGALLYTLHSGTNKDRFGAAISTAGDIDSDGFDDIVVGAPFDSTLEPEAGRAFVFSGHDGSSLFSLFPDTALLQIDTTKVEQFGSVVTGGNDLDADGIPDIVVGGSIYNIGHVYVISGADQSRITTFIGQSQAERIGGHLEMLADVNGDCIGDLLVGGPTPASVYAFQNGCGVSSACGVGCCNIPGAATNDNLFNIADVSFHIARIFSGGPSPACQDEADANGDNMFNIADVTYDIARIFSGGPMPVCGSTGL